MTIINGYPDYAVTEDGKIFSRKSGNWRELKPQTDTDGYLQVRLCTNGLGRLTFVHRIVAETFIPKPKIPAKWEVNHIDGNKTNNSVDNLEWCGRRDNIIHAHDNGLIKTRTPITATNVLTGEKLDFKGQHDAARVLGINQGNINHALKRVDGTSKGYKFEYAFGGGKLD